MPAPTDTDLTSRLRLSITRLARRLRQQTDADVSPTQISALATIERAGPLTLKELAARERVQPPTMTAAATKLEEQGLVTRTTDPTDRRVAHVAITTKGRRLLERARSRKNAYLERRLRALDPDDRATLDRAATILERILEEES